MVRESSLSILLAGLLATGALAGCGEKPATLALIKPLPAKPFAQHTIAETLDASATAAASSAAVATPPATPATSASDTASGTQAPSEPLLTTQQISNLVPGWTTFSGDPTDGQIPGDPINVIVLGTQDQLEGAMARAGWVQPATITAGSVLKMGFDLVRGAADPNAPVSNLYLFGRHQDLAWESNATKVKQRDHCRAWLAPLRDADGQDVWLISGTEDIGIEWDSRIHMTTHKISPDIDAERDLIAKAIAGAATLTRNYMIAGIGGGRPYVGKNGGGDPYDTDGRAAVLEF